MQAIYLQAVKAIAEIEKDNFEIVRLEFDILTTTITSRSIVRNLHPQYEYQLFAFSDDRIQGLEIELFVDRGGQWVSLAKDADNSAAGITYRPSESAQFLIEVRVTSFSENYNAGHFAFLAAHDGESQSDPLNQPAAGCDVQKQLTKLQFFTSNITIGFSDTGENFDFKESDSYVSLFQVDPAVSKFTHVTDSQTSFYTVNSKDCGDQKQVYVFDVTSEAGHDYIFSLDLNQNKLFVLGYTADDTLFAIIYELSRVFRE
jgi:hypothetical protein